MTMDGKITTTIEPLADVRSRQLVWAKWMQEATAGLADDELIEVFTQHTPFGSYVLNIAVAEVACDCE